MPKRSHADEIVAAMMEPKTVGELVKWLSVANPTLEVFAIEVGNRDGRYRWKRKITYNQWLKKYHPTKRLP